MSLSFPAWLLIGAVVLLIIFALEYVARQKRQLLVAAGEQQLQNPWAHVPKHYAGRWSFDYDEKNRTFFVHCGGHRICDAEDSEVCDAICRAHNAFNSEQQPRERDVRGNP
jgi:hypothetical protein